MKTRRVVIVLAGIALLGGIALRLLAPRVPFLRPYITVARKVPWLFTARDSACSFTESAKALWVSAFDQQPAVSRMHAAMRLLERDASGAELWETPRGRFWAPKGNAWSLASLLAEWQQRDNGPPQRSVRTGDIVLDCGANLGTCTREALLAGARRVVAIEPAPENLECLRRTLAAEIAEGRVILCPKGVWDREENRTMSLYPGISGRDSVIFDYQESPRKITISLTTIDRLVTELRLGRVDFIKMDIEGAEQRALAGARETLGKFKPRMAIYGYHLEDDSARIPAIVRQANPGYRMERGQCVVHFRRIALEVMFFY